MADLRLQPSISTDLRSQAHLQLIKRLADPTVGGTLDLSTILVYRLDSVDDSALAALAWQFDILSPLWSLLVPPGADPTTAQRALIKLAVPLHRRKGTPQVILDALAALGFPTAVLLEGQNSWGGTAYPSDQGWAVCRILVPAPVIIPPSADMIPAWTPQIWPQGSWVSYQGLDFYALAPVQAGLAPIFDAVNQANSYNANPGQVMTWTSINPLVPLPWLLVGAIGFVNEASWLAQITAIFEFFKPARCHLDEVAFLMPPLFDAITVSDFTGIFDSITVTDSLQVMFQPIVDAKTLRVLHNAEYYTGSNTTFGAPQPDVADGPVTLNGTPIDHD